MTTPLPPGMLRGAHSRAELVAAGVLDHELRGPHWVSTNRGLWCWEGGAGRDGSMPVSDRILRAAPLAGDRGALGGWAAAHLSGDHDLDGVAPGGGLCPVPIFLPRAVRCRRTHDIRVVRSEVAPEEVTVVDGVRLTTRVRTAADLVRFSPSVQEAVVGLDVMLRRERAEPRIDLVGGVAGWLEHHPRWRGVGLVRQAITLARIGVESPQETRTRLLWTLDAGLPMPAVQAEIHDRDGRFLARADLMDLEAAVVIEFDGGHHAVADQRARDHVRREGLQGTGLIVLQLTSVDLGPGRRRTVERFRAARQAGLARDRRLDRWVVVRTSCGRV